MKSKETVLKNLCSILGYKIIRERELNHGKQFSISNLNEKAHITLFNNGNALVQGDTSYLKEVLNSWSNNQERYIGGMRVDLPSSWREWNEEARWLSNYISKNGLPDEKDITHRYRLKREVLFHDYMFRNSSLCGIPFSKLENLIRHWFNRFCFMNLNIDSFISDLKTEVEKEMYFETSLESVAFVAAADIISDLMANYCPTKYVTKNNKWICPQVNKMEYDCVIQLVDALYPYFTNKMLKYTKGNLNYFLKHKGELKYFDLSPSTPIEVKMSEALEDAGLLTIPQYQAFDHAHRYKLDFLLKTSHGPYIAIECDGLQFHARPSTYIRDRVRDRYMQQRGIYVMRFSSVEIFNEIEHCIEEIEHVFWKIQNQKINMKLPYRVSYFGYGDNE